MWHNKRDRVGNYNNGTKSTNVDETILEYYNE